MIFVKYLHKIKYSLCVSICLSFANVASACTLLEFQKTTITSEASSQLVTLNWAGKDSDMYRFQAVANIPEGGVFWSLDTQVKGSNFAFKLPSNFAVLKAQISKNCDDADLVNVQTLKPIVLINEKHSCSLVAKDWLQDGWFIKFKPKNNILNYSFTLHELSATNTDNLKSHFLKKFDVNPPYLSTQEDKVVVDLTGKFSLIPPDSDRKYLVSVLPRCASGTGLPLAFLLK